MEIVELTNELEEKWRRYVILSKESTFFHQLRWKNIIMKTYGFIPHYLVAQENNEIKGIFPLFFLKNRKMLISIPFAPYGGPCADNSDIKLLFFIEIDQMIKDKKAKYVELRLYNKENYPNTHIVDRYVTSILELEENPEITWRQKMSGYVRNRTRKAIHSNLKIDFGVDHLSAFYNIYIKAIRDLGTPSHSFDFFKNLVAEFPQNVEILIASKGGKPIGCMFLLFFKKTITNMWSFSLKKYYHLCPNNLLYWEAIKYGFEKRYTFFDMGRSLKDTGVLRFKKQWGSQTKQLYYMHFPYGSFKTFQYSHKDSKRQFFSKIWSHMPVFLTETIGPKLRKNFP